MWNIICWIIIGIVAGAIAKWIRPGHQGGGFVVTTLLGIAGALLGGWIMNFFGARPENPNNTLNLYSLLVAVGGALIVLWIYSLITRKK